MWGIVSRDAHVVLLPSHVSSLPPGQCVRVVGALHSFDLSTQTMVLGHRGARVRINAALLGPVPIRRGDIWTILGYTAHDQTSVIVVEAQAGRITPDVDVPLLERCIDARQRYLEQLHPSSAQ
ncbi:hypothetical protein PTSG_11709 [Salpingoeca rosetta]|uniref:Uncharacterized protein n=1 Tax=Salpingoeca rosetta (strain ATCC 50818 / BSB-021) TaxID=946362 RepID=F2U015_SALR5|nr:uncharacterized protein PTSG_11709 [Salpingoeca rosetta]EGD80743.1 hypothetical protein PTSG_11709 [Salpingoeca rosetta]|eukprot:XP_004997304.1 hypothetical protein PTSG_11709 [Salpingoeca rosetta]